MKLRVISIFAIVMLICGCQNAAIPTGQRVIKVSFVGQKETFRLRVNRQLIKKIPNSDFTNVMTQLHLDYGDIVVWEAQRDDTGKELSWLKSITEWWSKHLETAQASFYCINSEDRSDFFSTPIYHWKAPRERQRPLPEATFYVDGISVGVGQSGFCAMLDRINSQKSGSAFIVAPRIKNEGSASPWIAGEQLRAWAEDAGVSNRFEKIFFGAYAELTDFARFADSDD